jgi:hypothetical protein
MKSSGGFRSKGVVISAEFGLSTVARNNQVGGIRRMVDKGIHIN